MLHKRKWNFSIFWKKTWIFPSFLPRQWFNSVRHGSEESSKRMSTIPSIICIYFAWVSKTSKRLNRSGPIFSGHRVTQGRFMDDRIFLNLLLTNSIFENLKNSQVFFNKYTKFCLVLVLLCEQREHLKWRRWVRSALKN